jgi:hypothetical protein
MIGPVEHWDAGPDEVEPFGPDGFEAGADALDDLVGYGTAGGSSAEARQAGDDAVEGLDKITARMSGGEQRSEQQWPNPTMSGDRRMYGWPTDQ